MTPGRPRGEEPPERLRPSVEEDVRRELETHLALRVEELVGAGWSEADARAEALRRFGDLEAVQRRAEAEARAHARSVRRRLRLRGLADDLRLAVRRLARSPRFTGLALLTLTLAIGTNAAVFSILHGVLLEPLPYPAAHRIVWIEEAHGGPDRAPDPVPWLNFRDWRDGAASFEAMAAFRPEAVPFRGPDGPVRAVGALVSEEFWEVFQPEILLGRRTRPGDHRPGASPAVVVSERFWRTQLGADPTAVGAPLGASDPSATLVGVVAGGFHFPGESDFWAPAELSPPAESRTAHNWRVAGLLRDGVPASAADRELDDLSAVLARTLPHDDHDLAGAVVTPLRTAVVGAAPGTLYLLMAAAGVLLVLACTNLASTVLARGVRQARELAVRGALGASRGRLLRQQTLEVALLSLGGAVLGLGSAAALVAAVRAGGSDGIPRLDSVGMRWEVVAFTVGLAALTLVVCGLVPALRATRASLSSASPPGAGDTGPPTRAWSLLVGGQVALASTLLVLGGALLQSFVHLIEGDPGFSPRGVVSVEMTLPGGSDPDLDAASALHRRLLEELRGRPEVEQVAVGSLVPLAGGSLPVGRVQVDHDPDSLSPPGVYLAVSPGYFDLLGIDVVAGRAFTEDDHRGAPHVAMVSRGFAERLWPGEDPLGKVLTSPGMDSFWQDLRWATVVGVVEDVKYRELWGRPSAAYYFPVYQRPSRASRSFSVLARAPGPDTEELVPVLRSTLRRVAPDLPSTFRPLEERALDSLAPRRLALELVAGFAAMALFLAGLGMYGVLSYLVASRRREMGVRLALGAPPRAVHRRVLGAGLRMVAGGLVAGCVLTALLLPLGRSLLPGSAYPDPLTVLGVAALLVAVGGLGAWIPAQRATRVDVMEALAAE